ncbi:beta-galactosidase [Paenibacillus sp. V4I3]|uniref:sugar-binding domain-containing protein n=1 Tax=Paenibacillus sp. V4I3 TaxID=3042305 RepID=UPI002789E73D|nr:sugar-binding domain-containing protein [Paenibacillus sp. V4I3]MDQ0874786.1 beta-galactosidase [Paenibacillus sp. V4I3]
MNTLDELGIFQELEKDLHRNKLSFNQDWRFFRGDIQGSEADDFDDSAWEIVHLPHTVRVEPAHCSGGLNYLGIAWYRRHFYVDKAYKDQKIFVEFEGAKHTADVWIDGKHLSTHYGGYLPFTLDITDYVTADGETDHVIVVKLDNSDMPDVPPGKPQGELDFCYYGGLYRYVWLHTTDKLHITDAVYANQQAGGGLFITYSNVSSLKAQVNIQTHIRNEYDIPKACSVTHYIVNDNREVVSRVSPSLHNIDQQKDHTFTQSIMVLEPKLWHLDHPYLYTVYTVVYDSDVVVDSYETKIGIRHIRFDGEGFHINGTLMKLIGANRHQEYVYIGDGLSDSLHRRDAIKLREGGFTIIRTGHYPQSPAFMDACDELGLMCIVPTPGWQWFRDNDTFKERSYQDIREMIRYHRNRPSIVLWEPILNETDYSEQYTRTALEVTHAEYPGDQCYAACDNYRIAAIDYDVVYGAALRDHQGSFIREWGDHYLEQAGPRHTHLRCSRGTRDFYPGGESGMLQSSKERTDILNNILATKGLSGGALWTGIDTNRGYYDNIAACGALDLYRLPKYSYYLFQSQSEPDLQISGIRSTPMVFIANDWTQASIRDITIYCNCERIRLYLNGRLLGVKKPDASYGSMPHAPFIFEGVEWEPGKLMAEAIVDDVIVATHTVMTPGTPDYLTLSVDDCGVDLKADGSDLIMVHVYVRDANGTVVPDAYNKIAFQLTGPAEIVGDGDSRVGSNPVEAEAGAIGVLIRATKEPGLITLLAESDGLKSATVEIISQPISKPFVPGKSQVPPDRKPEYEVDQIAFFSPPSSRYWEHWTDVAVNKPATASSELPGCSASQATSNIIADRWSERWSAGNNDLPGWWKVDLEGFFELDGCKIYWESDNTEYEYQVEVSSDDIHWKAVASQRQTGQEMGMDEFHESGIRYLRIVVTDVSKGLPSFYVVKVFGKEM